MPPEYVYQRDTDAPVRRWRFGAVVFCAAVWCPVIYWLGREFAWW